MRGFAAASRRPPVSPLRSVPWCDCTDKEEMKSLLATILAGLFCLGGCSTPGGGAANLDSNPDRRDSAANPRGAAPVPGTTQRDRSPKTLAARAGSPSAPGLGAVAPDAVITLNPETGLFTPAMEARLAAIAGELAKDERILMRLEAYVRGGGSPALDIGIADKALFKVKDRLQSLGVSARRMSSRSFGGEHGKEPDPQGSWVEIYLIRPANQAVPPGATQK